MYPTTLTRHRPQSALQRRLGDADRSGPARPTLAIASAHRCVLRSTRARPGRSRVSESTSAELPIRARAARIAQVVLIRAICPDERNRLVADHRARNLRRRLAGFVAASSPTWLRVVLFVAMGVVAGV